MRQYLKTTSQIFVHPKVCCTSFILSAATGAAHHPDWYISIPVSDAADAAYWKVQGPVWTADDVVESEIYNQLATYEFK